MILSFLLNWAYMRMGVFLEYKWVYEVILYESSGSCNSHPHWELADEIMEIILFFKNFPKKYIIYSRI